MVIKCINGLNVLVDKKLELMLAIQAVLIKKNPQYKEELEFIEIPPIPFIDELEEVIESCEHQYLIDSLLAFQDESICIEIALGLDDNYDFDNNCGKKEYIEQFLGNVNFDEFIQNFKSFAISIKWDDFFESHKPFYNELYLSFCDFPKNLNMDDFENFYGGNVNSYNYLPSILMNGGFGISHKQGNLYYLRGIQWWNEKGCFHYDKEYLLECLFHEFSHPFINFIVDSYIDEFTNLNDIFEDALKHNLPRTYSGRKQILLYEYFVRANAIILTMKYYPDLEIDDWIISKGFPYLKDIVNFTINNIGKYNNYREFFINEMIPYMNNILQNKIKF